MPRRTRYPFVQRNPDGRLYLRKPGLPAVRLPAPEGSPEFEGVYFAAVSRNLPEIGISRTRPRSMNALIVAYYGAAKRLLGMLSILMELAIAQGWRDDNPAIGIKRLKHHGTGFATWAEADIATYRNSYPLGTRERLVLELALGTAQRRGDLVRLGWRHVINGAIAVKQNKTGVEACLLSVSCTPLSTFARETA
jgi:integrase